MTIAPRLKIFALCFAALWTFGVFAFLWTSFLDDAYIGFTYMRNFIDGCGFVFNPGERIEGVTNIGWLLFLLLPAWVFPIPLAAKLTSLSLVAATLSIIYRIAKELSEEDNGLCATITILCTATSFDFLFFSFSGMETSFLAFLFAAILLLVLRHRYTAASTLMAAAFCVRPETLPIAPLWMLVCAVSRTVPWHSLRRPALVFSVIIAIIELGRFLYFGALLPNTFTAKSTHLSDILVRCTTMFQLTNIPGPFSSLLAFLVMGAGFCKLCQKEHKAAAYLLGSIVGAGILFCVYAKQDWTGLGRYFAPYIPTAFLLLTVGGLLVIRLLPIKTMSRHIVLIGALSALVAAGALHSILILRPKTQEQYPWYVARSRSLVPAAKWIEQNIPEDACIACRRIGCLSYYGKRYVFDFTFGLTDMEVARLVSKHRQNFTSPTHQAIASVWRKKQPDYILEDAHIIKTLYARPTDTSFVIHGIRYAPTKKFRLTSNHDWLLCGQISKHDTAKGERTGTAAPVL